MSESHNVQSGDLEKFLLQPMGRCHFWWKCRLSSSQHLCVDIDYNWFYIVIFINKLIIRSNNDISSQKKKTRSVFDKICTSTIQHDPVFIREKLRSLLRRNKRLAYQINYKRDIFDSFYFYINCVNDSSVWGNVLWVIKFPQTALLYWNELSLILSSVKIRHPQKLTNINAI